MTKPEEEKTKKNKKVEKKEPDIIFYHPDLFEVPEDGSPPYLKGYKCKKCGHIDFPKPDLCFKCWEEEFDIVRLSTKGKLYAPSDIYIGQPGMKTPYTIGYVDLPENVRVFAQLDGETGSFKCDEEVELTTGTIRMNADGLPVTSYKFRKLIS
ncbi:Zn-ribbon domain-containing OB-fold protein [Desulfobacterium sp. N47]|uniref:Zn-ribbon domain-containing OB-fold protein n=1 Tax=Desulfobacterium sp. N47 TaxID=3115210 RepID=UPI003CAACA29